MCWVIRGFRFNRNNFASSFSILKSVFEYHLVIELKTKGFKLEEIEMVLKQRVNQSRRK